MLACYTLVCEVIGEVGHWAGELGRPGGGGGGAQQPVQQARPRRR